MSDKEFSITITGNEYTGSSDTITLDSTFSDVSYVTDTGSEYVVNTNWDTDGISFPLDNSIDPDRVEKMSEHYPALKKAWENFYSIYKMVDQDYKGNYEKDEEIPF
jgi:hypothetical protein